MEKYFGTIIFVILFQLFSCNTKKSIQPLFVGENAICFEKINNNQYYKNGPPPPPFDGNIAPFNICISQNHAIYYYEFKAKSFCGTMLFAMKNFDPYKREIQILSNRDFHKIDIDTLKVILSKLDRRKYQIAIGFETDTIKDQKMFDLVKFIHADLRLCWKIRKLHPIEANLMK